MGLFQTEGVRFERWCVKMKTLLRSQDVWDLVKKGVVETDDETRKKKDAKALYFLQQAVDEDTFTSIEHVTTTKEAWGILKAEFQGDSK